MTFIERWFEEVWNKGREEAIDEMCRPDAVSHGLNHPDGTEVSDRQEFKAFHKQFQASFSSINVKVERMVAQDDLIAGYCVVSGVHSGDGLGWPATGKQVTFTGMCMARIEGGKLAETWNCFDFASMYRQLQQAREAIEESRRR
ncbi:MAG TPA: ester cyclase [Edaphobacter sp.]|nr:ester cyclase [Edaphobacter sp.]